jgi:hypothetical protein
VDTFIRLGLLIPLHLTSSVSLDAASEGRRGARHVSAPYRCFLALLALTVSASCGGGKTSTPTSPSQSTISRTVARLSLSSSVVELLVGNSQAISATAFYSDGTSAPITPTWSSSNTGVASVDSSGIVRALSGGSATVTASFSGQSASASVRSIPNYSGRWYGGYKIVSCSAPARWGQSYCNIIAGPTGSIYNIELNLGMSGSTVTGSWRRGQLQGSVSGSVGSDGSLSLQGTESAYTSAGQLYSFSIRSWRTTINGAYMIGQWDSWGYLQGESEAATQAYEMVSVSRQ